MARAAYQNLKGVSFGKLTKPERKVMRLNMKPRQQIDETPFVPIVSKPENRTILKLKTPLS